MSFFQDEGHKDQVLCPCVLHPMSVPVLAEGHVSRLDGNRLAVVVVHTAAADHVVGLCLPVVLVVAQLTARLYSHAAEHLAVLSQLLPCDESLLHDKSRASIDMLYFDSLSL